MLLSDKTIDLLDGGKIDELIEGTEFPRDKFLKGGGALVVGFSMLGSMAGKASGATARTAAAGPPNAAFLDSWVSIHADNTATIYFGKIEITGAPTGLLMIAAEELDLDISQVEHAEFNTEITPNQGLTAGSNSISSGGPQVRQAAAEARAVLLDLASKRLGAPVSQLEVASGVVSVKGDKSRSVKYGDLLGGKLFSAPNTGRAPVKSHTEYRLVGKRVKRKDTEAKVRGTYPYAHQLRVPGMLHGRVVRPRGQGPYGVVDKVVSIDESSIRNIKGARVVRKGDFVGVVAPNEQDAIQAATQLKVTWSESKTMPGQGNLWGRLKEIKTQDRYARNVGSISNGLSRAAKVVEAEYMVDYQAHASFGPSASVADVKANGEATVWCASQGIYSTRTLVSSVLGVTFDKVKIVFAEGAGCYGRNLQDDAAVAAALMSQLAGAPVRVQLTRDQEHGWEFYGPATLVQIRGSVDSAGLLSSYDYTSWQQPWVFSEASDYHTGRTGSLSLGGFGGADLENAGSQYKIANHRVLGKSIPNDAGLPKVAYLRAPAAPQALFASEQMMDELAWAAQMDPVAFRKANIENFRWLGALEGAANAAGWEPYVANTRATTGRIRKGRGIAIGGFASTFVGIVAEIEVDTVTGKIRVKHVYAAHDCGLIINPNTVEQQVEGCVVQGVSRALVEQVKFSKSRVTSLDWESYPILRYKDAPEITTVLINRPELRSSGAGEPATAPVAAAIANAFFDATGKRIRTMPMTPARVRATLKA
jgi:CO/xanthine dehydrogenase Mo-binding subunit